MSRQQHPCQWDDFPKTVLNFSFAVLRMPLTIAKLQPPIPKKNNSLTAYYLAYIPFILEESRAIISSGIEKVDIYLKAIAQRNTSVKHLSDVKPFKLVLQKNATLPVTPGNPLTLTFEGSVPSQIEHSKSMIVLLLKIQTSKSSEKRWLALASENFEGNQTRAKIVISSDEYSDFCSHFDKDAEWQAHYLGSVISEQRMYDHCLMQIENTCIKSIISARIPIPDVRPNGYVNSEVNDLNQSQKEALYAFFNAPEGSVLLLQGPPGTGKTKTLVNLLKCAANQRKRVLVSAHSNKAVLVLAQRANDELLETPMVLIGVESKVSGELKPILLNRWYDNIAESFATYHKWVEQLAGNIGAVVNISKQQLLIDFETALLLSKGVLRKFDLLFFQRLGTDSKAEISKVCGDYHITLHDFESIQSTINSLQRDCSNQHNWYELCSQQGLLMRKWTKINKWRVERYLLNRAHIIFSTLITSGRDSMDSMASVDYLLVDEAAQSVEAATMIPMRFQPKKVLLVGDTKQLPATVISEYLDSDPVEHPDTHYKWSMMWRLIEENRQPSLMLHIQYRMHPQICWWPAEKYYNNQLVTAPDIIPMSALSTDGITSRPYAIYQVTGKEENKECSHSICNDKEANLVKDIIRLIRKQNCDKSIGVITPYSAQKLLISEKLKRSHLLHEQVDVNTVDGFQGDERDIIIISFTRTHVSTFLREFRRLNVAITRPKHCLIILANPGLKTHDIGDLLSDARLRGLIFSEAELRSILETNRLAAPSPGTWSQLSQRAWMGNSQAQYEYHLELFSHDLSLSMMWLRKAAELGLAVAQFKLSRFYQKGNRVLFKNVPLSFKWLEKSADLGCDLAQHDLAKKFISGENYHINSNSGIHWCKQAAISNHVDAIVFLAQCYSSGQHVMRNLDEAVIHYRHAARLNNIASMIALAKLLEARDGNEEAIHWYRKLVTLNQHVAYYPLSQLLGATVEGIQCLQHAADRGILDAQFKMVKLLSAGGTLVEINLNRAFYYAKILADNNYQPGLLALVELLQSHQTLEISQEEKAFYYKTASDCNHTASHYFYAMSVFQTDSTLAHQYFKKAVDANFSDAYYYFAFLEKPHSDDNAFSYFKKSLECGKHVILSKKECVKYYINHNRNLELCLQLCEELYSDGERAFAFSLARLLDTGLAGKTDRKRALTIYCDISSTHSVASFYAGLILSDSSDHFLDLNRAKHFLNLSYKDVNTARVRLACLYMEDNTNLSLAENLLEEYCQLFFYARDDLLDETNKRLDRLIRTARPDVSFEIDHFAHYTPKIDFYLGKIFEEGLGTSTNLMRAFSHYQGSAKEGYLEGIYRLAYCYEHGVGTKRDWSSAKPLYRQATDQGHELAKKRLTWQYSVLSSYKEMNDSQLKNKKDSCTVS
jgi:TPR repeat protein